MEKLNPTGFRNDRLMRGSNPPKPSSRHRLGHDLPHKTEAQFRKLRAFGTFLGRTAGIIFFYH